MANLLELLTQLEDSIPDMKAQLEGVPDLEEGEEEAEDMAEAEAPFALEGLEALAGEEEADEDAMEFGDDLDEEEAPLDLETPPKKKKKAALPPF